MTAIDCLMLAIKPQSGQERQRGAARDLRPASRALGKKGNGMNEVSANRSATATETGTWRATLGIAALIAVSFIGTTLVTPLYVLYRQVFGFSEITLTLIYAVYVVGNLTALLFFGRLSDQIGRRRTAIPAIGVGILSTVVYLFALDTAWLFIARMLSGFAIGIASGTGTAWLAELHGGRDKSRATLLASGANMVGLSVGALLAGLLTQYAPWPLRLVFVLYIVLLVALYFVIRHTPETVQRPVRSLHDVSMKPRVGVPAAIRARFIAPAATAFGSFALFGFYAALAPSVLAHDLHETNRAIGGGIVFELCVVALAALIVTRSLKSRTAMLSGLVLLLPSLVLLVLAQSLASMPILLIGTALSGTAAALGYRGSLQVVNEIAPNERRAEVISTYLICCYVGNSVPVIGVGVLETLSTPIVASSAFAMTIALFAIVALLTGAKFAPSG
jgi:MFS family permease